MLPSPQPPPTPHSPLSGSHTSPSGQVSPPTHAPSVQRSSDVHARPSSHVSVLFTETQPCAPTLQTSFVHAFSSSQNALLATCVHSFSLLHASVVQSMASSQEATLLQLPSAQVSMVQPSESSHSGVSG